MLTRLIGLSPMRWLALLLLGGIMLALKIAHDTLRAPVVQHLKAEMPIATGKQQETELRLVLLADIHVAGPDMPPSRLGRIVKQVNALEPDMVLIAGDFVSDKRTASHHYATGEALAPLEQLHATHGVLAVPGNHDHWRDMPAIAAELERMDITLLRNSVAERAGLTIAGLDDDFTGRADLSAIMEASTAHGRDILLLSHSPDPFAHIPSDFGLMLAGHTHCGQIAWPWGGSPATMSDYGARYACGIVRERGNTLVTSGGIGTSVLPFRLFTQPEIWLITVSKQRE